MSGIPNLNGASKIYAVFGDPIEQVQTPRLINPIFSKFGRNIYAVPFHVTSESLKKTWEAFCSISNLAGIGPTVPHKVEAAKLCDSLTTAAKAVGAANSIQRSPDGKMHGALFDGLGFVQGLKSNRSRLEGASVLLIGGGGAGRAIAYALIAENIASLSVIDKNSDAASFTINMVNTLRGRSIAKVAEPRISGHTILINATPIGLKSADAFPLSLDDLDSSVLVADIASLDRETELLKIAKSKNCVTSDGADMLKAQIALIAGFAAGMEAGQVIGQL